MDIAIILLCTLFRLILNLSLCFQILKNQLRYSVKATVFYLCISMFAILVSISLLNNSLHSVNIRVILSIIVLLFYLVTGSFYLKTSLYQLLFNMFFIKAYDDASGLIGRLLHLYFFYHHNSHLSSSSIDNILQIMVQIFFFPLMWQAATKILGPNINSSRNKAFWKYIWLIPLSFYFINLEISPEYYFSTSAASAKQFAQQSLHKQELFFSIFWTIGTFFSYIIILKMIEDYEKNRKLEEKLKISELQIIMQQKQFYSLQNDIHEMQHTRLDLKKQLLTLLYYIRNNDYNKINQYLSNLLKTVKKEEISVCDNRALDAVAKYYINNARKSNIEIKVSMKLPSNLPISESDVCIILGNLMENALESCRRQAKPMRFISVKTDIRGTKTLLIIVKNSYDDGIKYENGLFYSQKHKGAGIGTASVQNIAAQYNGFAKFHFENGIFVSSVLLNP